MEAVKKPRKHYAFSITITDDPEREDGFLVEYKNLSGQAFDSKVDEPTPAILLMDHLVQLIEDDHVPVNQEGETVQ